MRPSLVRACTVALMTIGLASACATTARVNDVYTALDAAGDRRRTVFYTDTKEIHCIAELGISRPGTTVLTQIRQLQYYDFESRTTKDTGRVVVSGETAPGRGNGQTTLGIELVVVDEDGKDAQGVLPYPRGRYQCEVSIDGELGGIAVFNIEFPPCPAAQIKPNTLCLGFYQEDDICPLYGETSTDPQKCICTADKGWFCQ